jgi:serine/threonine protein phosphatase PrpC
MGRATSNRETSAATARRRAGSQVHAIVAELLAGDEAAPRTACATVASPKHPEVNEDRVLCGPQRGVAAVFDGVAGEAGGAHASAAACGAMAHALERLPARTDRARERWLADALRQAANGVALSRRAHPGASSQMTTATAVCMDDRGVWLSSAGDSPAYRVHPDGSLQRLTWPAAAVANPDERAKLDRLDRVETMSDLMKDWDLYVRFAQRNVIDDVLGMRPPSVEHVPLDDGDRVLLCTDGVSDNLTIPEMEAVIRAAGPDGDIAAALVDAASARSRSRGHLRAKRDDITAAFLLFASAAAA